MRAHLSEVRLIQHLSVVSGHDDEGIVHQASRLETAHELTEDLVRPVHLREVEVRLTVFSGIVRPQRVRSRRK